MVDQVVNEAVMMMAQAGGNWTRSGSPTQDVWAPIITVLRSLLVASSGLGLTVGVIYKLIDNDDSGKHSWTNAVMGASVTGLFIGLLAQPIVSTLIELI